MNAVGFHVYAALEGNLGLEAIRGRSGGHSCARGLARRGRAVRERDPAGADLVIVGCSQSLDQALAVISAATAQRADRPVVVLYHGSPNGFLEQAFEAGADDLIALPQSAGQLGFTLEKALRGGRSDGRTREPWSPYSGQRVVRARPSPPRTSRSHCRSRGSRRSRRPRPAVRRCRPRARAEPTRTIYDLAVSGGSLDGEKIDGFLARHPSGARALLAPIRPGSGRGDRDVIPP